MKGFESFFEGFGFGFRVSGFRAVSVYSAHDSRRQPPKPRRKPPLQMLTKAPKTGLVGVVKMWDFRV